MTTGPPAHRPSQPASALGPAAVRRIGAYTVVGTLGRGGMGVVYRCRDTDGNEVAVKTIQAAGLGSLNARLRREAAAIGHLRHPNIVGLIAVGEDEVIPYVVMELVKGRSLDEELARGALPLARAASIVRDVARALHHAHDRGVVHRDVKPANILIDDRGAPRLTDFGLAADVAATTQLTNTGQVIGTPQYMAPEQADGDRFAHGPHTDIWACGAVLYRCLTGRPPFPGADLMEVVMALMMRDPPAPRSLNPRIPSRLERLILRCLEKEPKKRWPSAAALADALEPFAAGEAPPPEPLRVRRASPALIGGVVVVAAGLGIGITIGLGGEPDRSIEPTPVATASPETVDSPGAISGEEAATPPPPAVDPPPETEPAPPPQETEPNETAELVERGTRALRAGDYDEAIAAVKAIWERDPKNPHAHWLQYRAFTAKRDGPPVPAASRTASKGTERYQALEPLEPRDRVRLAELMAGADDEQDAYDIVTSLLKNPESLDEATLWDARCLQTNMLWRYLRKQQGNQGASSASVATLERFSPAMPPAHAIQVDYARHVVVAGNRQKALDILDRYLAQVPQDERASRTRRDIEGGRTPWLPPERGR